MRALTDKEKRLVAKRFGFINKVERKHQNPRQYA
jgi:hypothetical protein